MSDRAVKTCSACDDDPAVLALAAAYLKEHRDA